MGYETDLGVIARHAEAREDENNTFRAWLKMKEAEPLDKLVHEINDKVSTAIDCTQCGNCCKSLVISVTQQNMKDAAQYLGMPTAAFKEKYIEESQQGELYVNSRPCNFLADNKCTIYTHRYKDCRDFPHLNKPGFQGRLLNVISYYSMCPIVYNVIEELKARLRFRY